MANINLEDREYLQNLREAAEQKASEVASGVWTRAYQHFADVANCLDAMEARTEDTEE